MKGFIYVLWDLAAKVHVLEERHVFGSVVSGTKGLSQKDNAEFSPPGSSVD